MSAVEETWNVNTPEDLRQINAKFAERMQQRGISKEQTASEPIVTFASRTGKVQAVAGPQDLNVELPGKITFAFALKQTAASTGLASTGTGLASTAGTGVPQAISQGGARTIPSTQPQPLSTQPQPLQPSMILLSTQPQPLSQATVPSPVPSMRVITKPQALAATTSSIKPPAPGASTSPVPSMRVITAAQAPQMAMTSISSPRQLIPTPASMAARATINILPQSQARLPAAIARHGLPCSSASIVQPQAQPTTTVIKQASGVFPQPAQRNSGIISVPASALQPGSFVAPEGQVAQVAKVEKPLKDRSNKKKKWDCPCCASWDCYHPGIC